jgi:hypothetical protein
MHSSQPAPISIDLGFSKWIASYLFISHLLAMVLLFLLDLGSNFLWILIFLIILSFIHHWWRYLEQKQPNSVIGLDWSDDRGWHLRLNSGKNLKAELSATSLVSRLLIVLHFKTEAEGRQRIAIVGDAIDGNQLRRLKVLLKMHNHFGV